MLTLSDLLHLLIVLHAGRGGSQSALAEECYSVAGSLLSRRREAVGVESGRFVAVGLVVGR